MPLRVRKPIKPYASDPLRYCQHPGCGKRSAINRQAQSPADYYHGLCDEHLRESHAYLLGRREEIASTGL